MKLDIRNITEQLRSGNKVNVAKDSLESDMKTIYDYYVMTEFPKFMSQYNKKNSGFKLIPFTVQYLGNLIGVNINLAVNNDVIVLYTNN